MENLAYSSRRLCFFSQANVPGFKIKAQQAAAVVLKFEGVGEEGDDETHRGNGRKETQG